MIAHKSSDFKCIFSYYVYFKTFLLNCPKTSLNIMYFNNKKETCTANVSDDMRRTPLFGMAAYFRVVIRIERHPQDPYATADMYRCINAMSLDVANRMISHYLPFCKPKFKIFTCYTFLQTFSRNLLQILPYFG